MANHTPYLQRRGDTFSFRIAVPSELLAIIGKREFIKSLQTTDKNIAVPLALSFAATAKQLFHNLRIGMPDSDDNKLRELLIAAKGKVRLTIEREEHQDELIEQKLAHLKEIKQVKLQAEVDAFKHALVASRPVEVSAPPTQTQSSAVAQESPLPQVKPKTVITHRLSEIVPVWIRLKNPAIATVEIYQTAVKRFERHFPELYAETIEKRHMREYVEWLKSEKLSPKSIEKEHGAIRAL